MKRVFCIVVTYNGIRWIEKCLNSLIKSSFPTHIVVIDNGSNDGTIQIIKNNYPQVIFIEAKENLGFGQANNIGINIAIANKADYVFLLNQDAWVETDTISTLIDTQINNPEFGIVSPLHLNGNGSRIDNYFLQYFLRSDVKDFISSTILNAEPVNQLIDTQFVNAAAWLITMKCILKTGGFDPIFFHYGEDLNYTHRVLFWKYRIGIEMTARVYHDREERTSQPDKDLNHKIKKDWLHLLNRLCDIREPQFAYVMVRRFARYSLQILISIFSFNGDQVRYNYLMAAKLVTSIFKIVRSRKKSSLPGSLPFLGPSLSEDAHQTAPQWRLNSE